MAALLSVPPSCMVCFGGQAVDNRGGIKSPDVRAFQPEILPGMPPHNAKSAELSENGQLAFRVVSGGGRIWVPPLPRA